MGTITINGKTYQGSNISINGSRVIIDGVEQVNDKSISSAVEIRVVGTIGNLTTDKSVSCANVAGNVHAGGSVSCDNVGGNVMAGGSVSCDDVGGDVTAGGSISRG